MMYSAPGVGIGWGFMFCILVLFLHKIFFFHSAFLYTNEYINSGDNQTNITLIRETWL